MPGHWIVEKAHLVCAAGGIGYAILTSAWMLLVPGTLQSNGVVIITIGLLAAVLTTAAMFTLAVLRGTAEGITHSSIGTGTKFLKRLSVVIMMTMATYAATLSLLALLIAVTVMVLLKFR